MMMEYGGFHKGSEIEVRVDADGFVSPIPRAVCGHDCACGGWSWARLSDGRDVDPETWRAYPLDVGLFGA